MNGIKNIDYTIWPAQRPSTTISFFFYQRTPIHIAAKEGHEFSVKTLVKKGADIRIRDNDGVSHRIILLRAGKRRTCLIK